MFGQEVLLQLGGCENAGAKQQNDGKKDDGAEAQGETSQIRHGVVVSPVVNVDRVDGRTVREIVPPGIGHVIAQGQQGGQLRVLNHLLIPNI